MGSVAFGGLLPLVQGPLPGEGRWELGFQAGVFSIFDMSSDSKDLINTDFWVGVPITARWGWFSTMMRVYHQSSHLGDEFLLRGGVDRVNLSYEASTSFRRSTCGTGAGSTSAAAGCSTSIRAT